MRRNRVSLKRTSYSVRLNDASIEVLNFALERFPGRSVQEVFDDALEKYGVLIRGSFDEAKEEARVEYMEKVRGYDRLRELTESERYLAPEPFTSKEPVLAATPVAIVSLVASPHPKFSRERMLAQCSVEKDPDIRAWCKEGNWGDNLKDVGWTVDDFVDAKLKMVQMGIEQGLTQAAPVKKEVDMKGLVQFRVEQLVTRLYNVAMGDKSQANFSGVFKYIQEMQNNGYINNGQLEQLKEEVLKKFQHRAVGEIGAKRMRKENAEVAVALFEGAWLKAFEEYQDGDVLSENERLLIGG